MSHLELPLDRRHQRLELHRLPAQPNGQAGLKPARTPEFIGRRVAHYNEERLQPALRYLFPVEYYQGRPKPGFAERTGKLARARRRRKRINRERLQATA